MKLPAQVGFLVLVGATLSLFAAQPKVAIVAEKESLSPYADFLTVALTGNKNANIDLLERGEIRKILGEQELSALRGGDYLKVGQTLHADGLIIIGRQSFDEQNPLTFRLVAAKNAVVLDQLAMPEPAQPNGDWTQILVTRWQRLIDKLTVAPEAAVPVSILNLRSALRTTAGETLERQITSLFVKRLLQEKNVFVLERSRLADVSLEKSLADDAPFWRGGYLLDGTINKNGYSPDKVTIRGKMIAPDGRPSVFEVEGAPSNLADVVEKLLQQLLPKLISGLQPTPWNANAEAEQFFEEAKWALKWSMFAEAQSASDASWVLGKTTADVAAVRIRSYAQAASADLENRILPPFTSNKLPDPDKLATAVHALELVLETSRQATNSEPHLEAGWLDAGTEALQFASGNLLHYYFFPELRTGEVVARLVHARAAARSVAELIKSEISRLGRVRIPRGANTFQGWAPRFSDVRTIWAPIWCDSPEQCALSEKQLFVDVPFAFTTGRVPRFIAWNWTDRQRLAPAWAEFTNSLIHAKEPLLQAQGMIIIVNAAATRGPLPMDLAQEFVRVLTQSASACSDLGLEPGQVWDKIWRLASGSFDRAGDTRPLFANFGTQFKQVLEANRGDAEMRRMEDYLAKQTPFDFMQFTALFNRGPISSNVAVRLLPLAELYQSNLQTKAGTMTPRERGPWISSTQQVRMLESRLRTALGIPPPPAGPRPTTGSVPPQSPNASGPRASTLTLSSSSGPPQISNPSSPTRVGGPPTAISRPPQIPPPGPAPSETASERLVKIRPLAIPAGTMISSACVREGKLWLELRPTARTAVPEIVKLDLGIVSPKPLLLSVDLKSFATDTIALDGISNLPPSDSAWSSGFRMFEIFRGRLYYSAGNVIKVYDLQTQKWSDIQAPIRDHARLFFIHDRLLLATRDSILEIKDNQAIILASARRRPAMNIVDAVDIFNFPLLFAGADRSIRALVAGTVFSLDTSGKWSQASTNSFSTVYLEFAPMREKQSSFDEGIALHNGLRNPASRSLWVWFSDQSSPELWFHSSLVPPPVFGSPPAAKWRLPTTTLLASAIAVEDSRVWFLEGRIPPPEGTLSLYAYSRLGDEPGKVSIRFEAPAPDQVSQETYVEMVPILLPSPAGLIVLRRGVAGFWLVPPAVLAVATQPEQDGVAAGKKYRDYIAATFHSNPVTFNPKQTPLSFGDPTVFRYEWRAMDKNGNLILDADELSYFDFNSNTTAEPTEIDAYNAVQKSLTRQWIADFDLNHDGGLDRNELDALAKTARNGSGIAAAALARFDRNQDGKLDPAEFEIMLHDATARSVLRRNPRYIARFDSPPARLEKKDFDQLWNPQPASNPAGASPNAPSIPPK